MILLLEGADGVGKSELCSRLSENLAWPVYKASTSSGLSLSPEFMAGHDEGTIDMARIGCVDVIMDRSFPSAIAYDYALDREPHDRTIYDRLDFKLAHDAVPHLGIVICSEDPALGFYVARSRGVDDVSMSEWIAVHDGYLKYLEWSRMNWLRLEMEAPVEVNLSIAMNEIERIGGRA